MSIRLPGYRNEAPEHVRPDTGGFPEEQLKVPSEDRDLRAGFQIMWGWRFLYWDSLAIFAMEDLLRGALKTLSVEVPNHGRHKFVTLVSEVRLAASDENVEVLLGSCWIISTYWLE